MSIPVIPPDFARRMRELYGDEGAAWLEALPGALAALARRWALALGDPYSNLTYNYVTRAQLGDGTAVVLKVGVVNPELLTEIAGLEQFAGRGCVRLLAADPGAGALLLEQLAPGTSLLHLADDEAATAVAVDVMQQLWRAVPEPHSFPTVNRWAAGLARLRQHYDGATGPLPADLVALAEALFAELLPTMTGPVLLHGDLHHDNILAATRHPWLALDPKGVIGEPAYETGAWLRNPLPALLAQPDARRIQARRIDQFAAALGVERKRIAGWGVAQAVLSAWWMLEDHGHGWEPTIACARLLRDLL